MKKAWLVVLAIGLLAVGLKTSAKAEESAGPAVEHSERHKWGGMMDLTDDQKAKMKAVKRAERKAVRPLFNKEQELRDTLKDQLEDKAADADLAKTLTAIEANRQALREQVEKFRAQKDTILTPTQRAKMILMRSGHRGRMGWGKDGGDRKGDGFKKGGDRECPLHKGSGHDDGDDR